MKNKLLFAMALCGAALSTSPAIAGDWEAPSFGPFVEPNLATDGTGGGRYYVYHVATEKFLCAGNDYGTKLSVGETGQVVRLRYTTDRIFGNVRDKAHYISGYENVKGWAFVMPEAPSNSPWHEVFADNTSAAYVDHNLQGSMLWQILPQENGTYRIQVIPQDPDFGNPDPEVNPYGAGNAATYMGYWGRAAVNAEDKNTVVLPFAADTCEIEWKFVAEETYGNYAEKLNAYAALNRGEEAGIDVSEWAAIYKNEASTPEELLAIGGEIDDAIYLAGLAKASPENPIDMTAAFVKNASFDSGNLNGWSTWKTGNGGNVQYQGSEQTTADEGKISKFAERWVAAPSTLGDWSVWQVIEGLPAGKYRLSALIWSDLQGDTEVVTEGFYIYASTGGMEVQGTAQIDPSLGSCFTPTSVEFEVLTGKLDMGFRNTKTNGNWSGVDNFKLEYLGAPEGTVYDMLSDGIYACDTLLVYHEASIYSTATKEAYDALVAMAKEVLENKAVEEDSVFNLIAELTNMRTRLNNDVAAYEKMDKFFNEGGVDAYYDRFPDAEEWPAMDAYYDKNVADLEDLIIDYTKADSIIGYADSAYLSDVKGFFELGLVEDVTVFATNVDFTQGATTGWTRSYTKGSGNDGGHYNNTNAESSAFGGAYEFWNVDNFDMYQEIKNLPNGSYKVSANAFYRPAGNANWQASWGVEGDESNKILAYIYGNDAQVELPHVNAGADTLLAGTGGAIQLTALAETDPIYNHWIPNSMESFRRYVNTYPEAYNVSVVCAVSDGTLRFGAKQPTKGLGDHWCIFTDFSIEYLGETMDGYLANLQNAIDDATTAVQKEEMATVEAVTALTEMIAAAQELYESEDITPESCTQMVDTLHALVSAHSTAINEVNSLLTLASGYCDQYDEGAFDEYDADAVDAFYAVCEEVVLIEEEGEFEDLAQVQGYVAQIAKAYTDMVMLSIDASAASKTDTINVTGVLRSPSFERVAIDGSVTYTYDGWTVERDGGAHAANYGSFECYNNNSFNVYQTVDGLLEGWYLLTFQGFYRTGGSAASAIARRDSIDARNAGVYVKVDGVEADRTAIPSILEVYTDFVRNGDTQLPDSLVQALYGTEWADIPVFIVNTMAGARMAFDDDPKYYDGKTPYGAQVAFYVGEGQSVTVGFDKTVHVSSDWTLVDNFKLYYCGKGADNQPEGGDDVTAPVETVVKSTNYYTVDGVQLKAAPVKGGVYIREDVMVDGSKKATPVLVK